MRLMVAIRNQSRRSCGCVTQKTFSMPEVFWDDAELGGVEDLDGEKFQHDTRLQVSACHADTAVLASDYEKTTSTDCPAVKRVTVNTAFSGTVTSTGTNEAVDIRCDLSTTIHCRRLTMFGGPGQSYLIAMTGVPDG